MGKLTDKIVFITGGSSGIGLATAKLLLRSGARVLLLARNEARLQEAVRTLKADNVSAVVEYRSLDVTDRRKCDEVLPKAVEEFGQPDILINSHGFTIPGYFEDSTNDELEQQWQINLVGVWNTIQVLLPSLEERRGTIVNVGSLSGILGTLGYSAYNATKFAVVGLSESLRNELKGRGVRVQVLCPQDTDTPGFAHEISIRPELLNALAETAAPLLRPEVVARKFLKQLNGRSFMITVGFTTWLAQVVKGLSPRLAFSILDGEVRKAHRTIERRR